MVSKLARVSSSLIQTALCHIKAKSFVNYSKKKGCPGYDIKRYLAVRSTCSLPLYSGPHLAALKISVRIVFIGQIDLFENYLYCIKIVEIIWLNYHHHHHHVAPPARISLTVSRHFSLSFIASGRSSGLHPVSSHSCCM